MEKVFNGHPIAAHQLEAIIGGKINLLPYEAKHVPVYHGWLQDPHIQEMTATEPMDLQTEYDYQVELNHSTNKFTKIIEEKSTGRLVGDINVFFQPDEDTAELNIMIADPQCRKLGFASEALVLTMIYAVQKYNVSKFFVKILAKNDPARRFFEKQGFKQEGDEDIFHEILMTIPADQLPRTNLTIVKSKPSVLGLARARILKMEAPEQAVGICEYANPDLTRFTGLVKKRYSDFIVDEIDVNGKVAVLTDVMFEESLKPKEEEDSAPTSHEEIDYIKLLTEELGSAATDIDIQGVVDFFKSEEDPEPFLTQPVKEKADRTKWHSALRSIFKGQLVTDTVGDCIRVARKSTTDSDRKKARLDKRNFQDPDRQPCVKFVLRKEFMETLEACQLIAKKIGLNPKDINAAGTKDKRGVTSQFITIRHVNPAKLVPVHGMAGGKIKISNIEKCDEPLRMGDLSGNRFTLVLREVEGENRDIEASVESLRHNGFINYFGLQRFGTMCVKSHEIGIKLLQSKWQEAIDLILNPRADETDGLAKEARRLWAETKDAKTAHDLFPFRYNAERQILWHFHKQGNHTDLVGAIISINRDLRLMYVHSVQSLLFNRLVSERIRRYGREPIVGDLVMGKGVPPTPITEESLHKYSICDVAMPMPGYDVKEPEGLVGELYREIVGKYLESLGKDCFQPKTKGLWDLPGAYRNILTLPKDIQCTIGHYDQADQTISSKDDLNETGSFKAVLVSFSLPSSCYATMALREIIDQPPIDK